MATLILVCAFGIIAALLLIKSAEPGPGGERERCLEGVALRFLIEARADTTEGCRC